MNDRLRNLTLPRLYLDSDTLIKGRIEALPELQNHPRLLAQTQDARSEIAPARRILDSWNPQLCQVSMYGFVETLQCAVGEYGLPIDRAVSVLSSSCNDDFTVKYAKFDLASSGSDLVRHFEDKLPDTHAYNRVSSEGSAIDANGQDLGRIRWGTETVPGGLSADYWSGSPETKAKMKGVKRILSEKYEAPKFERELFLRSLELAHHYDIKPKDSMHLAIALGEFDYLVTTDKAFLEAVNRKNPGGHPEAARPSDVIRLYESRL